MNNTLYYVIVFLIGALAAIAALRLEDSDNTDIKKMKQYATLTEDERVFLEIYRLSKSEEDCDEFIYFRAKDEKER